MQQQPTRLCLKTDVALTEQDGKIGLVLNSRTRLARDALQAEILRQLAHSTPTPESLTQHLCTLQPPPGRALNEMDAALALANFILEFSDYLES